MTDQLAAVNEKIAQQFRQLLPQAFVQRLRSLFFLQRWSAPKSYKIFFHFELLPSGSKISSGHFRLIQFYQIGCRTTSRLALIASALYACQTGWETDEKRRVPAALARFSRTALKAGGNLPDDFSAALFGSLSPLPFQRAPPWFSEVLKIAFRFSEIHSDGVVKNAVPADLPSKTGRALNRESPRPLPEFRV